MCAKLGINAYRGTEAWWAYRPARARDVSPSRRAVRLLDTFLPLSSHNAYPPGTVNGGPLVNVPSSRFLRPYTPALRTLEALRLRRICSDLTYAARHGLVYHLWWHPHNFGVDTERNMSALRRVLDHFAELRDRHGIESRTMAELAREARSAARPPAPSG